MERHGQVPVVKVGNEMSFQKFRNELRLAVRQMCLYSESKCCLRNELKVSWDSRRQRPSRTSPDLCLKMSDSVRQRPSQTVVCNQMSLGLEQAAAFTDRSGRRCQQSK